MKAATLIALLLCTVADAQQNSANRTIAVTPAPEENFIVKTAAAARTRTLHADLGKIRLREYFGDSFGPYTIFREAAAAAVSQAMNSPHEWGGGTVGYAERFANNMDS